MYRIDAKKMVARFGGRMELFRKLRAGGYEISVKTIEKWMERKSVPSSRLIVLMEMAKKENRPLVLDDYVIEEQPL